MSWIQSLISSVPPHYALLGIILAIGLAVVAMRAIIRLALRAFVFGILGVILLGAFYFFVR
jgi:hypothetical protein